MPSDWSFGPGPGSAFPSVSNSGPRDGASPPAFNFPSDAPAAAAAPVPYSALGSLGALPVLPAAASGPELPSALPFFQPPEQILAFHMEMLEKWAKANEKDARRDTLAFWALKIPAILASVTAGIWAHFGLTTMPIVMGAVASVCVIVDGIHPRGMLRNTHKRAVFDLRNLAAHMLATFHSSPGATDALVRRIIRESEIKREHISTYLRDAETALKPTERTSSGT